MNLSPVDNEKVEVSGSYNILHMFLPVSPFALRHNDKNNNWSDIGGYVLRRAKRHHLAFLTDCTQEIQSPLTSPYPHPGTSSLDCNRRNTPLHTTCGLLCTLDLFVMGV